MSLAKMHLKVRGRITEKRDYYGGTPLHWAAESGHLEVVALLLEKGANVNAQNQHGETPLHRAAWDGHLEVVRLLLAKGTNVEAKDRDGLCPLAVARVRLENPRMRVEKIERILEVVRILEDWISSGT
jgi:ankyrin repeat protein